MLSGTEAQIAIKLFGEDLQTLYTIGNRIKSEIGEVDGVVDANIEQQMERPQLDIKPRRDIMAQYGITISDFRNFLTWPWPDALSQKCMKGHNPLT